MIDLTAVVLTKEEEANVGRCLEKLRWLPKVLVLDSGSRDGTERIAKSFPNVEWATRPFDSFAGQCNYALSRLKSEWVLSMDADYILSDEVIREISDLRPGPEVCSYTARFVYCIDGKPLRGTLYRRGGPVLYRRDKCRYADFGHGHAAQVEGKTATLANIICHDDRKSMDRWTANQREYARREVDFLFGPEPKEGWSVADRLRRLGWLMPIVVPIYTLFVKGVILDGKAGREYVRQRYVAEKFIAKEIKSRRR
jgi:glycosyltransferase involved in cell wall biosynthesis